MRYYMIQYGNRLRSEEPVHLFKSYEDAQEYLYAESFQITSNPWLGTVYTYLHKEFKMCEDARIIEAITPDELKFRVKGELTLEQAQRLGIEFCEEVK